MTADEEIFVTLIPSTILTIVTCLLGSASNMYIILKVLRKPITFINFPLEMNMAVLGLIMCLFVALSKFTANVIALSMSTTYLALCGYYLSCKRGLEVTLMLNVILLGYRRFQNIKVLDNNPITHKKLSITYIAIVWVSGLTISMTQAVPIFTKNLDNKNISEGCQFVHSDKTHNINIGSYLQFIFLICSVGIIMCTNFSILKFLSKPVIRPSGRLLEFHLRQRQQNSAIVTEPNKTFPISTRHLNDVPQEILLTANVMEDVSSSSMFYLRKDSLSIPLTNVDAESHNLINSCISVTSNTDKRDDILAKLNESISITSNNDSMQSVSFKELDKNEKHDLPNCVLISNIPPPLKLKDDIGRTTNCKSVPKVPTVLHVNELHANIGLNQQTRLKTNIPLETIGSADGFQSHIITTTDHPEESLTYNGKLMVESRIQSFYSDSDSNYDDLESPIKRIKIMDERSSEKIQTLNTVPTYLPSNRKKCGMKRKRKKKYNKEIFKIRHNPTPTGDCCNLTPPYLISNKKYPLQQASHMKRLKAVTGDSQQKQSVADCSVDRLDIESNMEIQQQPPQATSSHPWNMNMPVMLTRRRRTRRIVFRNLMMELIVYMIILLPGYIQNIVPFEYVHLNSSVKSLVHITESTEIILFAISPFLYILKNKNLMKDL